MTDCNNKYVVPLLKDGSVDFVAISVDCHLELGDGSRPLKALHAHGQAEGREQAAKVAEGFLSKDTDWDTGFWNQCAERIAQAIRNLGAE